MKRLLIAAAILCLAVIAYRHYHQPQDVYVCPCDECDCGPPLDEIPPTDRRP